MKRLLILITAAMAAAGMQAQTFMHVYTKDGKRSVFNIEKTDSTLFQDTDKLEPAEMPNLLENGSFELWTDDMPDHWKSTTTASNAKLAISNNAHSGQYAVLVEGANSNKRIAYQELALEAGTYTFAFYAKATVDNTAQVKPGYVPCSDGKLGTYKYAANYTALSATEWTAVSYQFTLSEPTTVNLVAMNPSSSGQNILIDDAQLTAAVADNEVARMVVYAYNSATNIHIADIDSIVFVYQDPIIEIDPTQRLEFPRLSDDDRSIVLVHAATLNDRTGEQGVNYSVEWNPDINAQRWSCYQLYASLLEKNVDRYSGHGTGLGPNSQYPNDPDLPLEFQFTADPYPSTGYDHGHICPSDDRVSAAEANYQTFFMTNMMPQTHALNAGMWSRMETQVKNWGAQFDTLYVCKGGTINNDANILSYIGNGENETPIPRYFFMAVLGKSLSGYTAIGLWVDHTAEYTTKDPIGNFAMNIRALEQLTGIDFFHNLPDDIEESVETQDIEELITTWGLTTTQP